MIRPMRLALAALLAVASPASAERIFPSLPGSYRSGTVELHLAWGAPGSRAGQLGGHDPYGMNLSVEQSRIDALNRAARDYARNSSSGDGGRGTSSVGSGDGQAGRAGF